MSKHERVLKTVETYKRRHGATTAVALKATKTPISRYYRARKVVGGPSKTAMVPHTIELEPARGYAPGRIMVMIGAPNDVMEALRQL